MNPVYRIAGKVVNFGSIIDAESLVYSRIETLQFVNAIGKKVFGLLALVSGNIAMVNLPGLQFQVDAKVGNNKFSYDCTEANHDAGTRWPAHEYKAVIYGSLALLSLMARRRCMTNIVKCEHMLWQNYVNIIVKSKFNACANDALRGHVQHM